MSARRVLILGSTGSVGTQTLDVIEHLNRLEGAPRFRVVALAAGQNASLLFDQAARHGVRELALAATDLPSSSGPGLRVGPDAAERLVREVDCDLVVAAMVGVAGLPATLAAVERGRHVALANKETLVAAGDLVIPAARASGAALLPLDSEHSGVWQCLAGCSGGAPPMHCPAAVTRVTLTASGGPFRSCTPAQLADATPAQALRHPTWTMGRKITIDSASLMNKALELIEAHHLFGLSADALDAVVHPQSIVHALVEFADASVIAQLGVPDMRTPIQVALTWPLRARAATPRLDLAALARLEFEPVDAARFPAIEIAREAIAAGGTSGAVLNAANEACVESFLSGEARRIRFDQIAPLTREAMRAIPRVPVRTLADVLDADRAARAFVRERLAR
ncbi:MAG: 1-deoxy-D-xylulose-5-phosphate reductoisomerase [Planctomycetota bacterium]|nr:1-deoxy-D-xylulose-5-phosphate reductoisomerase [Planctomycetota bacterium]